MADTFHASQRLYNRVRPDHVAIADQLMASAKTVRNGAIVKRASGNTTYTADGSNGQYLVLIVRNGNMVTFMYSRENQVNCDHLRVNNIIRL